MKATLLSFLFCISSYCSYSQISLVYSSTPVTLNRSSLQSIPGGGWIGMKWGKKEGRRLPWGNYTIPVTLQKYDADFQLLKQVDLANSAGEISFGYSHLYQLGNKYYFFYLQPQKGTELGDIKAIEIDPATMELGEPKVIASSKDLGFTLPDFRYLMYLDVFCKVSPSSKSSMLLVTYRDNFFVCSMDENLNTRWKIKETSKTIPSTSIHSAEIDDAGNVYIGYSRKLKASYRKYSITGTSTDHPVVLPEGPANIILFLAKSDTMFVAGTYRKSDYCYGVYKGVLNTKGELASLNTKEFPASLLEPLKKEGWANTKSKEYGITPEFSAELQLSGDGSLIMLAEFSKETGSPGNTYMHAGSIMHVYFGKSEISFARAPKYSVGFGVMRYVEHSISTSSRFYFAFTTSSQTILLYGDNPDNLSRDIQTDAKVVVPSRQILVAARFDKSGNLTRDEVILQSIPRIQAIDPETIAIPVSIEGVDQLAILKK